jgi:two-component system, LytTR family, response regulator
MTPVLRVLIVDDEPLARRGIRQLAAHDPGLAVIGECRNGREALAVIEATMPDLVFLDVQMPELDGFGVIRERGIARMPAVVFVTAYDAYAVRAFEAHAVDYLVKPVSHERFAAALRRVREQRDGRQAMALARRLQALLDDPAGPAATIPRPAPPPARLVVQTAAGDLVLDAAEVEWIAADDYYAALFAGGRRYLLRESLASLAKRLAGARFVRVHRSAIVNLDRIREVRTLSGEMVVVLRSGAEVPVSRRRRERVARALRAIRVGVPPRA